MPRDALKPLFWVSSSRKVLRSFPKSVKVEMGAALQDAQEGHKNPSAKALQGFGGGDVLELIEHAESGAYRAVYTVKFAGAIFVLHAFHKKSKKGSRTPKEELNVVRERLKKAKEDYATYLADGTIAQSEDA